MYPPTASNSTSTTTITTVRIKRRRAIGFCLAIRYTPVNDHM